MVEESSKSSSSSGEEESTDFSFDPGSQVELEVEDTCCITGESVEAGFCRFPDYRRGTLMVMSKKEMLAHLRSGTTIQKFKEVLVERHGADVLNEYASY